MRIGVNVPNDIIERFKPLKGTYNLSQIFREAITSYIDAYERAVKQANADDMKNMAKKLAAKYMMKIILDWESIGRDDAKIWAQLASLEDFEGFFHNLEIHKKLGRGEPGPYLFPKNIPGAPRFENHIQENDEWFARQIELEESVNSSKSTRLSSAKEPPKNFNEWYATLEMDVSNNPYIQAKSDYIRGWVSYLTAVWQMVKDRIADEEKHPKDNK